MADTLLKTRIINLNEKSSTTTGDYLAIDNAQQNLGTSKISVANFKTAVLTDVDDKLTALRAEIVPIGSTEITNIVTGIE